MCYLLFSLVQDSLSIPSAQLYVSFHALSVSHFHFAPTYVASHSAREGKEGKSKQLGKIMGQRH